MGGARSLRRAMVDPLERKHAKEEALSRKRAEEEARSLARERERAVGKALLTKAGVPVMTAFLIAVLGGNATPSSEELKNILSATGDEADDDRIELLLSNVQGNLISRLIRLGCFTFGYKVGSNPAGLTRFGRHTFCFEVGSDDGAAAEAKKEEKGEEESDDDMCFSLFEEKQDMCFSLFEEKEEPNVICA